MDTRSRLQMCVDVHLTIDEKVWGGEQKFLLSEDVGEEAISPFSGVWVQDTI